MSNYLIMAAQVVMTIVVIIIVRWLLLKIYSKSLHQKLSANERKVGPMEMFFEAAHQNGVTFICCTLIRIQSSTSLSYDNVYKSLTMLAKKHPLLRARIIARDDGGKYGKYFVVNNEEDPIIPLKTKEVDASEYLETIEHEIHIGFENNLLWRVIYLKERHNITTGTFENSLVFVTHHAITDGISGIKMAKQFCKSINAIASGSVEHLKDIQSFPLADDLFQLIEDEIAWPLWQKVLLFPQFMAILFKGFQIYTKLRPIRNIFLESFPAAECVVKDNKRLGKTRVVYEEMNERETTSLIEACKANNCTVQGAVTASWHLATKQLMVSSNSKLSNSNLTFQSYCPVSLRKFCKPPLPDEYLGSYVSSLIDNFKVPADVKTSKEFWQLAQRSTNVTHDLVNRKQHLLLLRVYDFLDIVKFFPEYKLVTRDATVHTLTNMGRFDWRNEDDVFKTVQCFLVTGNHHYGMIFQNHISTINGCFNVATTYFSSVVKDSTAKKLIKLAFEIIKNGGIPK